MKPKPRTLSIPLSKALKTFPAIVVTGPRQSGKTTLLTTLYKNTHSFVSLEDPDMRLRAKEDPRAFLDNYPPPVFIDEIQYVPELLSYIKTRIDAKRKPGQWLFTGSQQFSMMEGVNQSLAGRVAVLSLLPFSYHESINKGTESLPPEKWLGSLGTKRKRFTKNPSIAQTLLRGSYPEIATRASVDRKLWCGSYISTYLERDVRNIADIGDLNQFERFLKLCATRTGTILNLTDMARDIGISVPTAKRWLSILEVSYQVFLLYPYYKNIGKRLVKSPKLYFNDTALATYLLGIHTAETLLKSPYFGNMFETLIVTDTMKRFLHFGSDPALYYLRTRDGLEVDLIIERNEDVYAFEVKSNKTLTQKHATSLEHIKRGLPQIKHAQVISQFQEQIVLSGDVTAINWQSFVAR